MTNRSVLAGDGIAYAGSKLEGADRDHQHACCEGVVYIGCLVIGEDGEEVDDFDLVPCRRCADSR